MEKHMNICFFTHRWLGNYGLIFLICLVLIGWCPLLWRVSFLPFWMGMDWGRMSNPCGRVFYLLAHGVFATFSIQESSITELPHILSYGIGCSYWHLCGLKGTDATRDFLSPIFNETGRSLFTIVRFLFCCFLLLAAVFWSIGFFFVSSFLLEGYLILLSCISLSWSQWILFYLKKKDNTYQNKKQKRCVLIVWHVE